MKIRALRMENFRSSNHDIPFLIFDPNDLPSMIGIEDRNCVDVFSAIMFVSDILSR